MGALNSWRESHASPVSISIAYWFANVNFCGEVAENMFAEVQDTKWRPPKGKNQSTTLCCGLVGSIQR